MPTRNGACARFVLPSPRSFPTCQTRRWSLQSHKQMVSKKTSRLHEKSYPSDHEEQDLPRCQKCARKQRATMVGTSHAREENGGKSDPRVRLLVKECGRDTCQTYSSGHEDELAAGQVSPTLPGLGNLLKRNHLPLDRAAACSGVCEDLREGLGFLLVGQRIVGIAQDSMQTAAHDG